MGVTMGVTRSQARVGAVREQTRGALSGCVRRAVRAQTAAATFGWADTCGCLRKRGYCATRT
jgi:hypothetical protein